MASAVGIHPIIVFASVLLGLKLAGIVGAIFGIPIAAVISAFFFYYLNRSETLSREMTSRTARHIEEQEARRQGTGTSPIAPATDAVARSADRTATAHDAEAAQEGRAREAEPRPQRP